MTILGIALIVAGLGLATYKYRSDLMFKMLVDAMFDIALPAIVVTLICGGIVALSLR
jgi:hypothetical protein